MSTTTSTLTRDKLYIGGEWVDPAGAGTIDVINPTTEEVIGSVPEGTADDADRAVKAARAAFDGWSQTPVYDRAALCEAIGAGLAERGDELAALITTELGMPIGLSRMIQAGLPSLTFSSMPALVEEIEWEEEVGNSLIVREAAGVVAAITPWNYPLHQIANKVAPAIAAGCTVVLKPSEVAPLTAFILAEVIDDAGLPAGVFNLVTGIYARSDIERGVHKAPANEVVRGLTRFEANINKARQDVLNPEGINALRFFEGRGNRVWGARTISSDPEWKYVSLRRYFAYLERSIDEGTQWAVFENNGPALWANVRRTVEDFLLNEWKMGALLGSKPEQAYFVRCDLSTMTQNDLDNGRLVCLIGIAPVRPAEFVIFRIGQWTATASG